MLIAATAYVGYRALKVLVPGGATPAMPTDFEKPGVTNGAGKFEKSTFYSNTDLGTITEIRRGAASLAIVGTQGVIFLNPDKSVQSRVSFSRSAEYSAVSLVGSSAGEEPFFLNRGSWSEPTIFLDPSGRELWNYNETFGVDDAAAGDLAGDGKIEVAIGMNGPKGIVLLDSNGKRIWSKPDNNVWHVEILPGNAGHPGRILHSNARGSLIVRDADGNILESHRLFAYLNHFALIRWNNEPEATHLLAADPENVDVYTANVQPVARFEAPAPRLYDIQGVTVEYSGSSPYIAVIRDYSLWNRSLLTINLIQGDHGDLVYREVLQDSCHGMATAPSGNGQALLLGCRDAVYEYDLPHSTAN